MPDSGIRYAADPWVAMVNRTMLRKVFPFLFPVRGKVVNFSDPWEECVPCGGEGNFSNFPTLVGRCVSLVVGHVSSIVTCVSLCRFFASEKLMFLLAVCC